ncbi:MAG: ABC transporter ATP-binding protein [Smithellaceae bacterium]|nr:ABC transporter ATP-binding protein [Smithellaceae bacterium]NLX52985.1 ABC transporter ATP-binding protein [Deltaproteobacteria bacterium]
MQLLGLNNVTTKYGDLTAIRDVSINVEEGHIISIVGSNGAGKTTLLNTISGVLPSAGGTITFAGKEISHLPPHRIVEEGIIQVPEGRLLFPDMTVLENLELGAFNRRSRKDIPALLEAVFNYFPKLQDRSDQMAGTLSGGEQQMVAIGRGLMAKPKLLMMDEPSLGLSPLVVKTVFETISKIKSDGITILLVEQNVLQSLMISDDVYVLENGSIILNGQGRELMDDPRVREAYLGI